MNTITRHLLIGIAALGLLGGVASAQNAPATPPRANAPASPAASSESRNATPPAESRNATPAAGTRNSATPPGALRDTAAPPAPGPSADDTAAAPSDDGPRSADDTSDADPPIVWTRDRARGGRGSWSDGGNEVFTLGGDSRLEAGRSANSVVSVMGSSTSAGEVHDAVVSVLGNTRVEGGRVGDASVSVLGNNYVNGEVDHDVVAVLGDVELGPNAKVRGDVVIVGGQLIRDPNAVIDGNVQHVMTVPQDAILGFKSWVKNCLRYLRPLAFAPDLGWAWSIALGVLALYALFAVVFRDPLDRCVQTLQERPGETIVASVLAMLLSPILFAVLAITVIGIAFVPIAGFAMLLATIFGKAVVLAWIGRSVLKLANQNEHTHSVIAVLIGGVIVLLLYTVPVLGLLVFNLLGILGFGAVVYTLMLSSRAKRRAAPPTGTGAGTGAPRPGAGPAQRGPVGAAPASMSGVSGNAAPYTAGFSGTADSANALGDGGAAGAGASGTASRDGSLTGPDATLHAASRSEASASDATFGDAPHASGSADTTGTGATSTAGAEATSGTASGPGAASNAGAEFASGGGSGSGGGFAGDGGIRGGATVPPGNGSADALSLPRAGFWIRILALLIDTIIIGVVFNVLDHQTRLQLVALAAYGAIMWKLKGTTVGGIVCNLKIVRTDGREVDWSTAIVRALGCFLSLVVCGLGFIWIAFDPGRQAWHDKIAGTAVVRVPQGVSLL